MTQRGCSFRLALAGFSLIANSLIARCADRISAFGYQWQVIHKGDWEISSSSQGPLLSLLAGREPLPGPRRPIQFALADMQPFTRVRVEADMRPHARSLIMVFAYRDPAHFDYAHLSIDTGGKEPVHNGIFHVYGGERVRISTPAGPAAFAQTGRWYHTILRFDGHSGRITVEVDGKQKPALQAVDLSLGEGQIGLGSFDETGEFRNVKITGDRAH